MFEAPAPTAMAANGKTEPVLESIEPSQETVDPKDAQEELKKLLSREELKEFIGQSSDVQGFLQVAFHGGLIALAGCGVARSDGGPLFWLCFVALSYLISMIFTGMHECVHLTAFRSKAANTFFAYLFGLLTTRGPRHYWWYHWAHHRHTGDEKRDPELQNTFIDIHIVGYASYGLYLSGAAFWLEQVLLSFRSVLGGDWLHEYYLTSPKARRELQLDAWLFLSLYSLVAVGCWLDPAVRRQVLWLWVYPSIVGQVHLRWYLLAEHRGCHNDSAKIHENTRTMLTSWFYARVAWNMPYHTEHHAWPNVPFHCLPALYRKLESRASKLRTGCQPGGDRGYVELHRDFMAEVLKRSA